MHSAILRGEPKGRLIHSRMGKVLSERIAVFHLNRAVIAGEVDQDVRQTQSPSTGPKDVSAPAKQRYLITHKTIASAAWSTTT